jgi:hypothetical protein
MIQPGDSAFYALPRTAIPKAVTDQLRGYGGTILSKTLGFIRRDDGDDQAHENDEDAVHPGIVSRSQKASEFTPIL